MTLSLNILFFKALYRQSRLCETLFESFLHKSPILIFISSKKLEVTIRTYSEVSTRSINREVALSQPYARSLSPYQDECGSWLKLRNSGRLTKDARS
jgi:hypothetical protein